MIKPIFNWLYDDEHITRAVVLIGILSMTTGIILCCVEAGYTDFVGKIGHFLLFTYVGTIEWGFFMPFLIGLILTIASFIIQLIKELANNK